MSARLNKQLQRLVSCPKDFEWRELCTVMKGLGFAETTGNGSAVAFRHADHVDRVIRLHKPHGRNPPTILVVYLRMVVSRLKEWGYLNE